MNVTRQWIPERINFLRPILPLPFTTIRTLALHCISYSGSVFGVNDFIATATEVLIFLRLDNVAIMTKQLTLCDLCKDPIHRTIKELCSRYVPFLGCRIHMVDFE